MALAVHAHAMAKRMKEIQEDAWWGHTGSGPPDWIVIVARGEEAQAYLDFVHERGGPQDDAVVTSIGVPTTPCYVHPCRYPDNHCIPGCCCPPTCKLSMRREP